MGPAGTTLVVVKEDILGKVDRKIPSMMDYAVHISKDSMFNTPAVYAVYVSLLTLRWIKKMVVLRRWKSEMMKRPNYCTQR